MRTGPNAKEYGPAQAPKLSGNQIDTKGKAAARPTNDGIADRIYIEKSREFTNATAEREIWVLITGVADVTITDGVIKKTRRHSEESISSREIHVPAGCKVKFINRGDVTLIVFKTSNEKYRIPSVWDDNIKEGEAGTLEKPQKQDLLFPLDQIDEDTLAKYVANKTATNSEYAVKQAAELAKHGFNLAAAPAPAISDEPPNPPMPLPVTAPRLWKDRPEGRTVNPAQFVREVYAPWLEAGVLTRHHIGQIDEALGKAYSQWIRPTRHPNDALPFAEGNLYGRIHDPIEAIERRRASDRDSKARSRAKSDNLSHKIG